MSPKKGSDDTAGVAAVSEAKAEGEAATADVYLTMAGRVAAGLEREREARARIRSLEAANARLERELAEMVGGGGSRWSVGLRCATPTHGGVQRLP